MSLTRTLAQLVNFKQPLLNSGIESLFEHVQLTVSIRAFGAEGDGVTDDAPAFRAAAAAAKAQGGLRVIVPRGDYLFSTAQAVDGVSTGTCVPMDGVEDFHLEFQKGARILMTAVTGRVNVFTYYCSADSAAAGNYSQRNSITGATIKVTRDASFSGSLSFINLTSSEDCEIRNNVFDATAATTGSLGITGTGGRGHVIAQNTFNSLATCFDHSCFEDCTFEKNRLWGGPGAVTGFNHFYDTTTQDNIRLANGPMTQGISSGLMYFDNKIKGYPSALNLRGLRDSWVISNRCYDAALTDATDHNVITVYTQSNEYSAGYYVSGIVIARNTIFGYSQSGNATLRGIYFNRSGGTYPLKNVTAVENIIHNITSAGSALGISIDNITDGDLIDSNQIDASTVASPYGRSVLTLKPGAQAGYAATLEASSGDIWLKLVSGGNVRFGNNSAAAATPANFSAARYLAIKDGTGTVYYVPVAAATW